MERIGSLLVAPSTERKAEPGRFGAALKNAASEVASGIAGSVALAAPFVPGGAVLAGALRAASRPALTSSTAGASLSASGGSGGGDVIEATRALQAEAQSFNLQYLQLQEAMQRESREFTSLTNVMKVKHDSAKAAINNIH
jgi:pyridoxal biosynthesis lyase PdxS